jgi:opacity protein-like surface antigen
VDRPPGLPRGIIADREREKRRPMKKSTAFLALLIVMAASASAQYYFDYPTYKKFELGVFGGMAFSPIKGATQYFDQWKDLNLTYVFERTDIELRSKAGFHLGGFFAYFFNPAMGFELDVEYLKTSVPTTATASFQWSWSDGRHFTKNAEWSGTGRLTSFPLSLNFVVRSEAERVKWTFSGGVTYFHNAFQSESFFGYGISTLSGDGREQYLDFLRVGLKIPKTSWASFGLNLGLGLNFKISGRMDIKTEARYFSCREKKFVWEFVKGFYDGIFFPDIKNIDFNDNDIELITEGPVPKMETSLKLNPSFFRLSLGFVIFWGEREY